MRKGVLWIGLIVPLLIVAAGAALMVLWLPDLPNPAATHWSGGPHPDSFDAPSTYVGLLLGLGGGIVLVFGGVAYGAEVGRMNSYGGRWLATFNIALAAFLTVTLTWSVGMQRGLRSGKDAGSVTPGTVAGTALAVVLGAVAWLLLRCRSRQEAGGEPSASGTPDGPEYTGRGDSETPTRAHSLPLAPGERVMWSRSVVMGKMPLTVLGVVLLFAIATTIPGAIRDHSGLWMAGPPLLVAVLLVISTLTFRVVIGNRGFIVRGLLGFPRVRISAAQVADVRVVTVDPFAEFGGWGWRFGRDAAIGFVLRKGPGLEVRRTHGRPVVVTLDDAAEAAAVLRTVARSASQGDEE